MYLPSWRDLASSRLSLQRWQVLAAARDRHAAIGDDDLAGDKAGGRRGEEKGDAGDVLGLADAAERRRLQAALELRRILPERPGEVGLDQPGGDAVDADIVLAPLDREVAGELEIRRLGDA